MKHRLTALAAAAAVAFGFSGDLLPALNAAEYTVFAAETVDSGTCGENLTWTLDDAGTLTISGTGEMTNWRSSNSMPWYDKRESIKNIVIKDGVTGIGDYAFNDNYLISVTIPDSVTSIGKNAFKYCTRMSSITIPDSVTIIGNSVFSGCTGLT
ncbi:MAG TPA: hypothetical protein DCG49_06870, partial [Ruminococcus sp.]|nr:hypothetical protein [Ruminococcus sp.]